MLLTCLLGFTIGLVALIGTIILKQRKTAVSLSTDRDLTNTSTPQLTCPSRELKFPSHRQFQRGGGRGRGRGSRRGRVDAGCFSFEKITSSNAERQCGMVLLSIKKSSDVDKYLRDGNITTIEKIVTILNNIEIYPNDKETQNMTLKLAECYLYLARYSDNKKKEQEYINNGIRVCPTVSQLDTDNQEIHKCYMELLGLKVWVEKSDDVKRRSVNLFVHHAKIAFESNHQDSRLYHILGRFLYELISFFNFDMIDITYDDVLSCFHKANYLPTVCPRERKENMMFIGICYSKLWNSDKSLKYLEGAREIGSSSRADISFLNSEIDRLINKERAKLKAENVLKSLNPDMVGSIKSTITIINPVIHWDDIIGLKEVKEEIKYELCSLVRKKTLFEKDCECPRGILLCGPPGTGKTFIGKCIGSQIKCTLFNVSSSSLTSKWFGDGEKMVRTLFAVARCCQPAVIFVDEIDGLLTRRNSNDHDVSRRMKTESLIEMDGVSTNQDEKVFVIGATNRPQDIDQSAMRRFRHFQIPLPDREARLEILKKKLSKTNHILNDTDFEQMTNMSKQYSIGDLNRVFMSAHGIRKRELNQDEEEPYINLRPIRLSDLKIAFAKIKPSVSPEDLKEYEEWCKKMY